MDVVFITKEPLELGLEENMIHWNGNESTKSEANPHPKYYEPVREETGKQQICWKHEACFHSVLSNINMSSSQLYLVSYTWEDYCKYCVLFKLYTN